MFKVYRNMSPFIFEIFNRSEINYELHNFAQVSLPYAKTVHHRTESISYLGPKIWEIVPNEIKELATFSSFKNAIKNRNLAIAPLQTM